MWFRDVGLPGLLSGELDVDGVNVGRWHWVLVKGDRRLRYLWGVQRSKGSQGRQHRDEALSPVVLWRVDGNVGKVFVNVARPIEANDTEVFTLTERTELAGITAAAQANDGELGNREVTGVEMGGMRAERSCAVFDSKPVEYREVVHEVIKGIWEHHAVESEFSEICKGQGVVVHGVGDMV